MRLDFKLPRGIGSNFLREFSPIVRRAIATFLRFNTDGILHIAARFCHRSHPAIRRGRRNHGLTERNKGQSQLGRFAMGAFYGSVQVRSEDRSGVKAVAEEVARALHASMLVAPVIDGWVGLYPDMNGQNEGVGAAMAGRMDADVLHLIVHDDDVFAYWFYRRGELVDSYWSLPGYFGE